MKDLIGNLQIRVNDKVYLKDPNSSEVGRRIVGEGILMIDEMGQESFTFRKLAQRLQTSESTIYRYFESKHKLLIYITSWYWGWLEYQLVFGTSNVQSPEERFRMAINIVARDTSGIENVDHIDLEVLNQIVISESSKAYLTKEVDEANKVGFYAGYKRLVGRIADMLSEINPKFKYPHSLVSTIVEGIHHQKYFAEHLPSLTDISESWEELATFYSDMALATIKKS